VVLTRQVNQRQEKAIKKMDKEHGGIPKLLHTMNEELRIAKASLTFCKSLFTKRVPTTILTQVVGKE
jgi:hypothetical protein